MKHEIRIGMSTYWADTETAENGRVAYSTKYFRGEADTLADALREIREGFIARETLQRIAARQTNGHSADIPSRYAPIQQSTRKTLRWGPSVRITRGSGRDARQER